MCSSEPCPSVDSSRDSFVLSATWFQCVLTSRSLHRESVLRTSLSHPPWASRARHRLSVTFEMLGLCCCPNAMSSSSWILSFAPSMANSTLNSAQFVCLSRCHHSSCLFMNCLLEQLDTVDVSARPRDDVLHWQRRTVLHQMHAASVTISIHMDTSLESLQALHHLLVSTSPACSASFFCECISCMLCITSLVTASRACSASFGGQVFHSFRDGQVFHSCRDDQVFPILP